MLVSVSRLRGLSLISLAILSVLSAWLVVPQPALAASSKGVQGTPICGVPPAPGTFVPPPEVNFATLPLNSQGEHELILSVHRTPGSKAAHRFCYRYRLNGIVQTTAPLLRVHRGEHFALRIVNDLRSPSRGENVPSSQITPCTPMAMAMTAPAAKLPGYLGHARSERYVNMPAYDTNIHLHGFQGPAAEENVFLSTLSTPMHACEYHITIPATQPPGTYFYHPHVHGASGEEVARGLSGMWVVEPDVAQIDKADEHAVILRIRIPKIDDNPFMPDYTPVFIAGALRQQQRTISSRIAYDPFHPPPQEDDIPLSAGGMSFDATGCRGSFSTALVSVNGADAAVTLDTQPGRPQLLRVLNATPDTNKLLRIRDALGHIQPMHVVARDGIPMAPGDAAPLSSYVEMNGVMLPPAGRADILITSQPGQDAILYSDHYCFGAVGEFALKHDLVRIHPVGAAAAAESSIVSKPIGAGETRAAKLLAYARLHAGSIRHRAISYTAYAHPSDGDARFYITETTNKNFIEHPFWPEYRAGDTMPSRADIVVKAGSLEEWTLFNATTESHTFHIHQMAFVAEDDSAGPVMLDTVLVPNGKMLPDRGDPIHHHIKPGVTHVLLDFRHVPRGTFVFHCHMLFHEDRGMMGIIRVE